MAKAGRPSKLTPALRVEFCRLVERGHYSEIAAQSLGVEPRTLREWLKRGENGEQPYAEFRQEHARALAAAEVVLVDRWLSGDLKGHSFGPAKAAQEFLSRTRLRFAERVRMQVADELEEILSVVERECSRETFSRVLEALAARDRGEPAPSPESDPSRLTH